ncbi:MAG: hypothetical protein NZ749_08930 [bacterium]|nr:hypothetical protein [bacterium]
MRLSLWLCLLVFATPVLVAQTARQDRLDDASIEQAARTLQHVIRSAVTGAGGDPEKQHVHLVLAFSTGHFNKDPLGAQAAREIAWRVVRDLLVQGDRVSCFAWEMGLWDHLQGKENSLILSGADEQSKSAVRDLFPNTVQDGSQGGHDTERAIVEISQRLGDAKDAVIVLITNDAQSVAPRGQQTIGADNPAYQQVLQTWTRLPQVNQSGASLVLPFKVIKVDGGTADRKLDIVMVTPHRFSGTTLTAGTRSELLQSPPPAPPDSGRRRKFSDWLRASWWWILIPAALLLIGIVAWRALPRLKWSSAPAVTALKIGDEQIDLTKVDEWRTICLLAGEHYRPLSEDGIQVVRVAKGVDVLLAEISCQRNMLELQSREAELQKINDEWVEPGRTVHRLKIGQPYLLHFIIRKPPKPAMPARTQEVSVRIEWVSASSSKIRNVGG